MKDPETAGAVITLLLVVLMVSTLIWLQVSVWNECRETHSWFYCLNLLRS